MNKKMIERIAGFVAAAVLLLPSQPAWSSPTLISFQGVLSDWVGVPLTETLPMTFEIFDHETSGSPGGGLWQETRSGVVVTDGVYGVLLGSVNTGTLSPDLYAGYFDGNLAYTGSLINASDRRMKEDITPLEGSLAMLEEIHGVYYVMKNNPEKTAVGVIAQDVERVLPEAVAIIDPESGYLGVNYTSLVPVLIEATKELRAENEALKALVCLDHPDAKVCQRRTR